MPETEVEIKAKLEILAKLRSGEIILKDCPFCGSPGGYHASEGRVLMIYCTSDDPKCLGRQCMSISDGNWKEAIDKWNRRA